MRLQFIKLFLLIFVTLFLVAIITDKLYQLSPQSKAHQIDVQQVFAKVSPSIEANTQGLIVNLLQVNNLHWPDDMTRKLMSGDVVSLKDGTEIYYYRLDDSDENLVLEMGPFQSQAQDDAIEPIVILFYLSFAAFLFIWVWPMFRDLEQLNQASKLFSKQKQFNPVIIKPSSSVYPVAQSFNQMASQLLRYMSLQRFLASTLSHDIRTPVTRIDFCLEVMNQNNFSEMKSSIQQDIDEIDLLTHEFIEFSKLEEEYENLNIQIHDVNAMLASLVSKMRIGNDKPIDFVSACSMPWQFDENFLRRAVQNVIANALIYAKSEIRVQAKVSNSDLVITVEDDGNGLSDSACKEVTQAYVRGKDVTDLGNGYGLGLAFAKVICEWHQGNLIIEQSQALKGLKVVFRLPGAVSDNNYSLWDGENIVKISGAS
ncbi:sensor histidine kinase KdpD [Thalassotalea sp. PS06]|uniref:sensor histidine kinase n=1 Tax=Thalassotalea sp. PS06 TaxID=2594005 RepID=UPI00163D8A0E|nr:HAMP domain-containing sensor histidine kinase [Thalassotalea sp. PS06]